MMKQELFVVGDLHGEFAMVSKLLEYWDRANQSLLFIGDLMDRGKESKSCLKLVQRLVEEEGAICLSGNHEDMLINFLASPNTYADNYFLNGGLITLQSFLGDDDVKKKSPSELAKTFEEQYPEVLPFLQSLPYYYEWERYVFVHAGIDVSKANWRDTDPKDFLWIRDSFHHGVNRTGKTIVFGHTPTFLLHKDRNDSDIWQNDDKIGIDGGAVFGGTLHGIVCDKDGLKQRYGVKKDKDGLVFSERM